MSICKDISELTPRAQTACNAFLEICKRRGLRVRITETYRSQERQNELYAQGRTKPGKVVTWTKNSRHTSRRAWDICQNIKGKEYDTSTGFFEECGKVAVALGISWGGSWSKPDMPHFEISENWQMPKSFIQEEKEMEELKNKVAKLEEELEKVKDKLPKVYHYTQDIPEWGASIIQELMDRGIFAGRAADDLDLTEDMLRMFVVNYNAGLYRGI